MRCSINSLRCESKSAPDTFLCSFKTSRARTDTSVAALCFSPLKNCLLLIIPVNSSADNCLLLYKESPRGIGCGDENSFFSKKRPPLYGGLFSNHPGFYFFLLPVGLIHSQAQPLGPELEGIFRGPEPAQVLNHGAGSPVNAGRDALVGL